MSERVRLGITALALGLATLATLGFVLATPPREAVPAWLGLVLGSVLVLGAAAVLLSGSKTARFSLWVMAGALALRLAALCAPVSLSDDIHRYVWDGALVSAGHDPYASRPSEVAGRLGVPALSEARLSDLNSPDYYTVYPPLSQLAFAAAAIGARATGLDATLVLRALFVVAELMAVWALLALCARLERPRWWVLVYAWNPLVFWEVAAGGHTEALALPFLVLSCVVLLDERPARAGALLGLAASAKLTVLVIGPIALVYLARRLGPRRAAPFALASAAVLALAFVPFASPTLWAHVHESLLLYVERFSFNAPVFYGARYLMGYRAGVTPSVDGALVPWLSLATVALLLGLALAQDGDRRRLAASLAYACVGYLLLSRVVHPWYLLPALALGVAAARPSIAILSVLATLSYLRYDALGVESPWVVGLEWAPFALVLVLELVWPWLAARRFNEPALALGARDFRPPRPPAT